MDVHKDSISIGILRPDDSLDVERIFHDEESVRRFIARMGEARQLTACYEAGPTGYELQRLLLRLQVPCHVVAPSLIPKAPGDRVKTDRRDCRRLARLHRAGELIAIRVPSPEEEAVRDLCRARGMWSSISIERGAGSGRSCCGMARSGGAARTGASSMSSGCWGCALRMPPSPRPSPTTARSWRSGGCACRPSSPTWFRTASRIPTPRACTSCAATGEWTPSARSPW